MRVRLFVAVTLFAVVIAGFALVGLANLAVPVPRPGQLSEDFVARTDGLAVRQFDKSGNARELLRARVTAADLEEMGIDHPDWAKGEPPMLLVIYTGTLSTMGVTNGLLINVYDLNSGEPTVTILTSRQDTIERVLSFGAPIEMY